MHAGVIAGRSWRITEQSLNWRGVPRSVLRLRAFSEIAPKSLNGIDVPKLADNLCFPFDHAVPRKICFADQQR